MTTATLDRQPAPITAMKCEPWCDYQNCWEDPAASAADGIPCVSAELSVALEGPQPLAARGAWPSLNLYLGPDAADQHPGLAVLLAYGDSQGIYLTPTKARELAAALTSLAALAEGTAPR